MSVEDASRGIDTQGSPPLAKAWADMAKAGVKRIQSADIAVSAKRRENWKILILSGGGFLGRVRSMKAEDRESPLRCSRGDAKHRPASTRPRP